MTSNVRMILDEVNARIKLAEAKTAEDPSNFDAFPGAENDKPVPADMKNPDPEVKDEGPASRTEVTGAEPGSDAPVEQDHLYEADEAVLTPEKKPAETADANAKEAEAKNVNPDIQKVAADILSIIKGAMAKKAENAEKTEKVEKKAEEAEKTEKVEKKAEEAEKTEKTEKVEKQAGCCGGKSDAKAPAKTTEKAEEKKPEKKASETISLESKILDKIASIRMAKEAGAKDALTLLKAAEEYNRGANDAKALIQKLAQALEESAESGDAAEEGADGSAEGTPEAAGAADAEAALADAAAADAADAGDAGAGAEGDDAVTPEEVTQAVNELVEEGQISSEDAAALVSGLGADETGAEGGEGADVTEDQIAEGIAQAIENGDITQDEAQQLVQELVDAGADESVAEDVAAAGTADAGAAEANAGAADAAAAGADEAAGAADAEAALADAQKQAAAHALNTKIAEVLQKKAADAQIARYQKGFIQKCAEYGADPQKVAQYIKARVSGQL